MSSQRLGDLVVVKHGFAFAGEYFCEEPTPYQLITPGNFALGGGFQAKPKYYRGPIPDEYVLQPGDLVVTMTDLSKAGDTLGYSAVIPESNGTTYLHNQRIGLVVIKQPEDLDRGYLHYLLRSPSYRQHVLASASGSTVKHTSPGRIENFVADLPPLPVQQRIGGLLGSLDDKIEHNRKTSRTLEGLARAMFKAWFVDFEPVHAKAAGATSFPGMPADAFAALPTRFTDSEVGPVPQGWEVQSVSGAFEVNPSRRLTKGEQAAYLDMKNMPTDGYAPETWEHRTLGSGMKFMNGDTLVARITPCLENGKTAFVDFLADGEVGWGSTEYIVLRSKPPLPVEFAYLLARTSTFRDFAIQNMSGTSGRQRVSASAMEHYRLAVPTAPVAAAFGPIVAPLFAWTKAAMDESRKLAELRDYLLPKLLSGEVRVNQAARATAGAS